MDDETSPKPESPTPDDLPQPAPFAPGFKEDDAPADQPLDAETAAQLDRAIAQTAGAQTDPQPAAAPQIPEQPPTQLDAEASRRLSDAIEAVVGPAYPAAGAASTPGGGPDIPDITMDDLNKRFPGLQQAIEVKGWEDMMDRLDDIKNGIGTLVVMGGNR
jgi:hypothetical protein